MLCKIRYMIYQILSFAYEANILRGEFTHTLLCLEEVRICPLAWFPFCVFMFGISEGLIGHDRNFIPNAKTWGFRISYRRVYSKVIIMADFNAWENSKKPVSGKVHESKPLMLPDFVLPFFWYSNQYLFSKNHQFSHVPLDQSGDFWRIMMWRIGDGMK